MAQGLVPSGGGGGALVITVNASQAISSLNVIQARIISMTSATQSAMGKMSKSFNLFTSMITKAVSALAGFLAIRQIVRMIDGFIGRMVEINRTFVGFIASMSVIKGSVGQATKEYEFLLAMSNRLGTSVESAITQYHRLAAAMKNVDKTGEMTRHIFTGISEAAVVLQSKGRDVTLIFEAVQQMASKGRLSLEELQRQLGNTLPGAISISARAMMNSSSFMEKGIKTVGAAEQELRQQIAKGTINVYEYLLRFSNQLKKEYGAGVAVVSTSFAANFERMRNAIFEFYRSVGSSKAMEGLTKIVKEIAALFNDSTADSAAGFGQAIGAAFETTAEWIGKLDSDDLKQFFGTLNTVMAAGMIMIEEFFSVFRGFGDVNMQTPLLDFVEFVASTMAILIDVLRAAVAGIETLIRGLMSSFNGFRNIGFQIEGFAADTSENIMGIAPWMGSQQERDKIAASRARRAEFNEARSANLDSLKRAAGTFVFGPEESAFDRVGSQFGKTRQGLQANRAGATGYVPPTLDLSAKSKSNPADFSGAGSTNFKPGALPAWMDPNGRKAGSTVLDTEKYFNPLGDSDLQKIIDNMIAEGNVAPNGKKDKKGSKADPVGNAYMRETTRLVKELGGAQNELNNVLANKNITEGEAEAKMRALLSTDERYIKMSEQQRSALMSKAKALDAVNKAIEEAIKLQESHIETLQQEFDVSQRLSELGGSGYESQYRDQSTTEQTFQRGGKNEHDSEATKAQLRSDAIKRDNAQRLLDMGRIKASIQQQNEELLFQSSLYGKSSLEVQKMTKYREIDLKIQQLMVGATQQMQLEYIKLGEVMKASVGAVLDEIKAKQDDVMGGMQAGVQGYMDSISNRAGDMEQMTVKAFQGMEDAFVQFAETGKLSFADLSKSIMKDLIRLIYRYMILKIMQSITGMSVGGNVDFSGVMGAGAPAIGTGPYAKGGVFGFAKGGTFTNKLFNQSTPFTFANGSKFGEMGEAGPEAVMPLAKNSAGQLGVHMVGAGSGESTLNLKVEVYQGEGTGVTTKKEKDGQGGDILKIFIGEVAADIKRGGQVAGAITQVYGIKRSPRSYA